MRPVAIFFAAGVVAAFTAVLAASCKGFPDKTCAGDKVNAMLFVDGGGNAAAADKCTICMQENCCDLVGACGENAACTDSFKATQACVIATGAPGEPSCKSKLDPLSRQLFECMRPKCGDKCGIPSCDLDQAVTLFGSSTCDHCIGGSCCQPVNDCYKNRQCKLFLECITNHCPRSIGPSLTATSLLPKEVVATTNAIVCGDAAAGHFTPEEQPAPCLLHCLSEFAPNGPDASDDEKAAACLAFSVYTCGADAGCGSRCTLDDSGMTALGPYPEDDPDSGDSGR